MNIPSDVIGTPLHDRAKKRFSSNQKLIGPYVNLSIKNGGLKELATLIGLSKEYEEYQIDFRKAPNARKSIVMVAFKSYLHGVLDTKYPESNCQNTSGSPHKRINMNKFEQCKECGEWEWNHLHKCPTAWVCHHEHYNEEGKIFYGHGADDAAIKMVKEINDEYDYVGETITVQVEVDGVKVSYSVSIEPSVHYSIV